MLAPFTDDVLIPLADGFVCRTSVAVWLIKASFRLNFAVVDDQLEVSPRSAITQADDRFLRTYRDELLACVRHIDQRAARPA